MPDSLTLIANSESETEAVGKSIGAILEPGVVVGLCGTLGSGKTFLTRAIAESLGVKEPVVSPTYTICIPYSGRLNLIHMDAYRIEQPEEVDELDLFESVAEGCVLIVEWADRVKDLLPDIDLWIDITPDGTSQRTIELKGISAEGQRLIEAIN